VDNFSDARNGAASTRVGVIVGGERKPLARSDAHLVQSEHPGELHQERTSQAR
jgi:hypothetical protein